MLKSYESRKDGIYWLHFLKGNVGTMEKSHFNLIN